ncbi:unnamed protein product, partial [Didymodactylos carnosus]
STARAIREINDDDNDDNEFLDASDEAQGDLYSRSLRTTEDNDNELTVDEDEADVYHRHRSVVTLEQILFPILQRGRGTIFSSFDGPFIDDLNKSMAVDLNEPMAVDLNKSMA